MKATIVRNVQYTCTAVAHSAISVLVMKYKLFLFVFLIGMTSGEYPGNNVTSSSTPTDLPAAPVLEDDLPLTFKVVTTKTEAPATTPPPFVTAKPARTLHLVTGRTDSPAASPDSIGNQDEVVPVAARPPLETMRIVTGHSTVTPSPNSRPTTSPEVATPPTIRGPSTATTPSPISPTKSAISPPSAVSIVNSASSPSPASVTGTTSSSLTEKTEENAALGTSTTSSSVKSKSTTSPSSGAHSHDDALDLAAKRDQKDISDSTEVTKNDGNFRGVVSSTAVKSNDGAGSTKESVQNGTTNISSHVLSTGSAVTNSKSSGGSVKLSSSSTETINDNGSEGDGQPNRLDTNTGSRAVLSTVLSLLLVILQVVV